MSSLSDYIKKLYKIPVLTRQEERDLASLIEQGDETAIETLVTHNLRFVISVVKRNPHWTHSNVDFEDIVGFGNMALFYAAKKWKPQKNIRFATYAKKFIILSVNRGVANTRNMIRLPVNVVEEIRRMKYQERKLTQELKREPSVKELADKMDVPVDRIIHINSILMKEPISLEIFEGDKLQDEEN